MSKNVDFLISYEHKSRELESILLIKIELEKRGYSVMLHGLYDNDFDKYHSLKRFNPRVVIVPAAYDYGILVCFAYNLVGFKRKIVNLQWEQILTLKEEADINGYHNPKGLAKQAVHLCWGHKIKQRLINSGVNLNNAIVTGPIHLDLLRPEFKDYFISREKLAAQFNLDLSKSWFLFVSSFSFCNLSEIQLKGIADSYGMEDTNYFISYSIESKKEILNWFERLLKDKPELVLIYRPHPEEIGNDIRLLEMEKKYQNFRVIPDYALKHWVKASDYIYNWYSTSMADIYFSNKPCQILRPIQIEEEHEVSIFEKAEFITNFENFLMSVKGNSNYNNPLNPEIMKGYYDLELEGKPNYSRISDVLEDVYQNKTYNINFPRLLRIKQFIYDIKSLIESYIFSTISKNSILWNVAYIKKSVETKEKIAEWYKRSYYKSVATKNEITEIEIALKKALNNII